MPPKRNFLISKVKELANQTGFVERTIPENLITESSSVSLLMASNYAILVVGIVEDNSAASLSKSWTELQTVVRKILSALEKDGMLVDGYLIIALPSKPTEELHTSIREIELNTSICRKHVVWPHDNSDSKWDNRLRYVTVLGLPANTKMTSSNFEGQSLPPKAKEVLELYDKGESYKAILELITSKPNAN